MTFAIVDDKVLYKLNPGDVDCLPRLEQIVHIVSGQARVTYEDFRAVIGEGEGTAIFQGEGLASVIALGIEPLVYEIK